MWYNYFLSNNTSNNYDKDDDKRTITILDIFIVLIFASFGGCVVFLYLKLIKKK